MIPSDTQIDREIRALPGLGRMQAINRIRSREWIMQTRRDARHCPLVMFAEASDDFDSMADTLADDLAKYRARCDAALARTQERL